MGMKELGCVSAVSSVKRQPKQYFGKKKLVGENIPWTNDMVVNGFCKACKNDLKISECCLYCDGVGKPNLTKTKKFRMNFYKEYRVA